MCDEEWAKFFELLGKAVHHPKKSAPAKMQAVIDQAELQDGRADLEEFVGWFGGEVEDNSTKE